MRTESEEVARSHGYELKRPHHPNLFAVFKDPVTGTTKRGGYFVELASNDPIDLSNSLTLEQAFGWRGLCVEANPLYAPGYADRYCQLVQAVVGQHDGDVVNFNFRNENGNAPFGGIAGWVFAGPPDQ